MLPCLVIKDTDARKVWVTPPGNEPRPTEVLAEGRGNAELVVEKGSYEYQLSCRHEDYN